MTMYIVVPQTKRGNYESDVQPTAPRRPLSVQQLCYENKYAIVDTYRWTTSVKPSKHSLV